MEEWRVTPRHTRQWSLFDFDTHFDEFWAAWNKDDVQSQLQDAMDSWCADTIEPIGAVERTWRRGDPLWHLSSPCLWDDIIEDAAGMNIGKIFPPYSLYKRTMEAQCLPAGDEDSFGDMVLPAVLDSDEYAKLKQEHEPKPGTLESLVMFGGRKSLTVPLALCAQHMFPNSTIDFGISNGYVLIDEGIVFDLEDFYLSTRRNYRVQYVTFGDVVALQLAASDNV